MLALPSEGAADDGESLLGDVKLDESRPWQITADQLSYDDQASQYVGQGNVVIAKEGKKLTADFVRFNQKTMEMFAAGNVTMRVGNDVLSGSRMDMNLDTETGTLYDGTIFIQKSQFTIKGATIQKLGEQVYAADEATVTTCDGDNPDWKITGKNLKIDLDRVGVADHATLWARSMPILYAPSIAIPIRRDRESGFLFPQFGGSDNKGFNAIQPYFWAISDSMDATFYVDYMTKRGVKPGAEFRYVLDDDSRGTAMADGFDDQEVNDGKPENDKWGYDDDNFLRPNDERYWFRMKHDQSLPYGFTAKLDLDVVSDQDYLQEFKQGYGGFYNTNDEFIRQFGRGLDDVEEYVRLNRLNLNKTWSNFSLNAETRWMDNVVIRRQLENDPTLQRLPFVEFDASKQQLLGSPVYWELDSQYVNFYREFGDTAQRVDAYPRVYLPMNLGNYLSFEPSAGIRETLWYVNKEQPAQGEDDTYQRHQWDIQADLSSEIYKIFRMDKPWVQALKNTVRPRAIYTYISDEDQDDLPFFDDTDRIGDINEVTYSVTTTLTSKSAGAQMSQMQKSAQMFQPDLADAYIYNQFLRFKIEQTYDFDYEDTGGDDEGAFSPIYAELMFSPFRYFSMRGELYQSPYEDHIEAYNLAANLADNRGDRLMVEHINRYDASRSLKFDLHLKITERLMSYVQYERDLFNDNTIRNGFGVQFKAGCWSIDAGYLDDGDKSIGFMVRLYGLGEFGQRFGFQTSGDPVEYD